MFLMDFAVVCCEFHIFALHLHCVVANLMRFAVGLQYLLGMWHDSYEFVIIALYLSWFFVF